MKQIAIFASGSGTNAENIYKFFSRGNRIGVALVIYDRKDAGVAQRMQQYGVETVYIPGSVWRERPNEILHLLRIKHIDMVVLAGFLRMVPDCITEAYAGRILNIHPSLLPAYGGKGMFGHHVHEAVIANGETKSGVTVHYVTSECDGGEILMQEEVEITPEDTAETLEAKIHPVEYSLFPRAIVAAFARLDNTPADSPAITPPPVPAAEEWAQKLNIKYDAGRVYKYYDSPVSQPAPATANPGTPVTPPAPANPGSGP
ncbi:MAG: phosphoribosylglycinamide formyltransferase, partial [Muribaculaceae bacterium]|nr:phosphoribosylglycinamide formyltransferase [Muribaculaceae bacterium]